MYSCTVYSHCTEYYDVVILFSANLAVAKVAVGKENLSCMVGLIAYLDYVYSLYILLYTIKFLLPETKTQFCRYEFTISIRLLALKLKVRSCCKRSWSKSRKTKSRMDKIPNPTKSRKTKFELDEIPNRRKSELDKIPNRTKSRIGHNPGLDKISN